MTKSKKALIAGAALAGLLAGTTPTVQASNLLSGMHATAQDQKPADSKAKDKHSCKGQNSCKGTGGCKSSDNGCKGKNSCKGKGGCATDGSKMPKEDPKR
jgi:type IV secretory pathway TrbL component